jgi:uroporphyrinogen decarboxylase
MHFLDVFAGKIDSTPPFWFMRQAGRYLPEYRALREKSGGFLPMCYTPEIATEITMQPIRRFGMSAAIIFSDILVIPHGLGQHLEFLAGEGPNLKIIENQEDIAGLSLQAMQEKLQPVYQAISQTRAELAPDKALIGFAGAPWTLLCYMLDGNGKADFIKTRSAIYANPALCEAIIALLVQAITQHLSAQIKAGANAVQIFDSWAEYVPAGLRDALIYQPTKLIVEGLRKLHPNVPIICFPRAIGEADLLRFAEIVRPDGISVDQFVSLANVAEKMSPEITLQGNIDNLALCYNLEATVAQAAHLGRVMQGRRFIANLGHGVLPPTPIANMQALIDELRG